MRLIEKLYTFLSRSLTKRGRDTMSRLKQGHDVTVSDLFYLSITRPLLTWSLLVSLVILLSFTETLIINFLALALFLVAETHIIRRIEP